MLFVRHINVNNMVAVSIDNAGVAVLDFSFCGAVIHMLVSMKMKGRFEHINKRSVTLKSLVKGILSVAQLKGGGMGNKNVKTATQAELRYALDNLAVYIFFRVVKGLGASGFTARKTHDANAFYIDNFIVQTVATLWRIFDIGAIVVAAYIIKRRCHHGR